MSQPASILIVDDDPRHRRMVTHYLNGVGFQTAEAGSGSEMRLVLNDEPFELVLLDLVLPDDDGLALAREIRAGSDIGIIMVTGKGETVDRIVGLEVGADDYVTKPFDLRELLARIRTVLRRTDRRMHKPDEPLLATAPAPGASARFYGWTLDLEAHELLAPHGDRVHLTSAEFQLLATLVTRPNRVLSRGDISRLVSGREWSPLDRSTDVLVGKLRRKIESDPRTPSLIKTIRGVGYKFTAHVEIEES